MINSFSQKGLFRKNFGDIYYESENFSRLAARSSLSDAVTKEDTAGSLADKFIYTNKKS